MPRFSAILGLFVFLTAWLVSGMPVRAAACPVGGGLDRAVSQSAALEPADITAVIFRVDWLLIFPREHQAPKVAAGGAEGILLIQERCDRIDSIIDGGIAAARRVNLAMTGEVNQTCGDQTTQTIPLYDGTGHVVALTDLNQNLLAEYAYGPFGEPIHATGPLAQANPWRYATKYLDSETGLYYFGHRYYDPVTGQWLSREPLGESESINLYSYCHNNPIGRVDVQGLATMVIDTNGDETAIALLNLIYPLPVEETIVHLGAPSGPVDYDRTAVWMIAELQREMRQRMDMGGMGYQRRDYAGNNLGPPRLPFFQDGNGRLGWDAIRHNLRQFEADWKAMAANHPGLSQEGYLAVMSQLSVITDGLRWYALDLQVSGYLPAMARYQAESLRQFLFSLGDAALFLIPVPGTETLAAGKLTLLGRRGVSPAARARGRVGEEMVDLFRAVSPAEFTDIFRINGFRPAPGGASLAGKQFGHSLDEVVRLADHFADAAAVIGVRVPRSVFNRVPVADR